jgi:3',5'-cyclic AMP phosphodiesterase CpdA
MTRTYAIIDVRGRFDLLLRALEAISIHARERRVGSLPEHKIVLLGNTDRGPDREEITEYLRQERQRGGAPVVSDEGAKYGFISTDLNPNRFVIGIFNDEDVSNGPDEFIHVSI